MRVRAYLTPVIDHEARPREVGPAGTMNPSIRFVRVDWTVCFPTAEIKRWQHIRSAPSKATGIPQAQVLRIGADTRAITLETAVRLGVFLGVDARNWLNLQRAYVLKEFERTRGEKVRKTVVKWAA